MRNMLYTEIMQAITYTITKTKPIKLESRRTGCPKIQAITQLQSLTDKTGVQQDLLSQNASHYTVTKPHQ